MEPTVSREVTVDAPAEEVWAAIADEDARAAWLGEDGADRPLQVEEAVEGQRITWTWGPEDPDAGAASSVTITLLPHDDGTTGVRVVERLLAPPPAARTGSAQACAAALSATAWSRRLLGLELWLLLALARV